ncbi:DEAD-box ATP-dependent RNA helicase CshA [Clostridium tepidiprofundi DSM 19306]|uniref:DEAD-box ATP-dependent RNA helicase CshA n=1 Tax=Clostridium tepidiprofundi DSM 19306 TaxID=1121338 RepID=A0A151B360_9CLOT|nr:DEAD/DEAH box helicase [Clostridium tepidiprofundi]KYH34192.1 DEAD-box ATP-dependent RNA helicase CshA [Clostridium tepidiprofundi DSM 19306]
MDKTFEDLGLDLKLIDGLRKQRITVPTDIQIKVIPLAIENKDIVAQSQTGTGKTLAYLLPLFKKIDISKRETQAIILAPTHELVMQIQNEIKLLNKDSGIEVTSTAIIGKASIKRQIERLKEKPHIIVGSTGRILELIKMRKIKAHTVKTIVFDEADKLLDENNISEVKAVIKTTLKERQLMVFSATINEDTLVHAKELMSNPEIIKVEEKGAVNEDIFHIYLTCERREKIILLRKVIASINPKRVIVFINKNDQIQLITSKLRYHKIKAFGLFGNASKEDRKKAMQGIRSGKIQVLISSDLAARGLDIKGVTHIVNLDLPEDSKEYLHRSGRTGRAGEKGVCISIVTDKEVSTLRRYEREFGIKINRKKIYKGVIS